ncbi:hypothetical protein L1887_08191 [Cichorium endivia]|nr:hypothetical protein L1887_08191 [Cichorium endivia]
MVVWEMSEVALWPSYIDNGHNGRYVDNNNSTHHLPSSLMKLNQKLLKVREEAGKLQNTKNSMEVDQSSNETSLSQTRVRLYDLAVSRLLGLVVKEVDLLFVAIEPALKDAESSIQKKAYKVLSTILEVLDLSIITS